MNSTQDYLTLTQLCKEYGFSASWVYKATSARQLPHYKPAGRLFFRRQEINDWLAAGRVETTTEIIDNLTTPVSRRA